jgi:hypothetical protein
MYPGAITQTIHLNKDIQWSFRARDAHGGLPFPQSSVTSVHGILTTRYGCQTCRDRSCPRPSYCIVVGSVSATHNEILGLISFYNDDFGIHGNDVLDRRAKLLAWLTNRLF